jgi:hypothetical protein
VGHDAAGTHGNHDAELAQMTSHGIDASRPGPEIALTHAMERSDRLLLA